MTFRAWVVALVACALWAPHTKAYEIQVYKNTYLLSQPGRSFGKRQAPISAGYHMYLGSRYDSQGNLWVHVKTTKKNKGWIHQRYAGPALSHNVPLHLREIPAPLLFEYTKRQMSYMSLKGPQVKKTLKKNLILLEVSHLKQKWDHAKQRLNFLELSQRIQVKISARELKNTKATLALMEKKFLKLLPLVQ